MKLIIAGSRDLVVSVQFMNELFQQYKLTPKEIISGGARGIDRAGEDYARYINDNMPNHTNPFASSGSAYIGRGISGQLAVSNAVTVTVMEADWKTHGKKAGPIRNKQMAAYADRLLLIWDGKSKGSASMKKEMLELKKPVYEVIITKTEVTP